MIEFLKNQWYRKGKMLYRLNVRKDVSYYIDNPTRWDYEKYRVYRKVANSIGYSPKVD